MDISILRIAIEVDKDWVALNVYRMALQRIAEAAEKEPWAFSGEEAGDIARRILKEFPGSHKQ